MRSDVILTGGLCFSRTFWKSDVQIKFEEAYDGYGISFSDGGMLEAVRFGGEANETSGSCGLVLDSSLTKIANISPRTTLHRVSVEKEAIHKRLSDLIERPATQRILFNPVLDTNSYESHVIKSMMNMVHQEKDGTTPLFQISGCADQHERIRNQCHSGRRVSQLHRHDEKLWADAQPGKCQARNRLYGRECIATYEGGRHCGSVWRRCSRASNGFHELQVHDSHGISEAGQIERCESGVVEWGVGKIRFSCGHVMGLSPHVIILSAIHKKIWRNAVNDFETIHCAHELKSTYCFGQSCVFQRAARTWIHRISTVFIILFCANNIKVRKFVFCCAFLLPEVDWRCQVLNSWVRGQYMLKALELRRARS